MDQRTDRLAKRGNDRVPSMKLEIIKQVGHVLRVMKLSRMGLTRQFIIYIEGRKNGRET